MAALNALFVQVLVGVGLMAVLTSALNCWSTDNEFVNRRDPGLIIKQESCDADMNVSCKGESYQVGRQWFFKLGCSNEDKTECTTGKMGEHTSVDCYCKTDYCNNANSFNTNFTFITLLFALAQYYFLNVAY